MSKSFAEEYRRYADNDVPDLWSRIEAGIDAYEAENKVTNIESSEKYKSNKKKYMWLVNPSFKRYGGIIAAAACMVLAIGVVKGLVSPANKDSAPMAESAAAPAAAEEAYYEDAAADEACAESVDAEAPALYESEAEEAYDAGETYADEAAAADNIAGYGQDNAPEAIAEAAETYDIDLNNQKLNLKNDTSYTNDEGIAFAAAANEASEDEEQETFASGTQEKTKAADNNAKKAEERTAGTSNAKEITITATLDSVKKENGRLVCTLTVKAPGTSNLKAGDKITAYAEPDISEKTEQLFNDTSSQKSKYHITLIKEKSNDIYTIKHIER